MRYVYSSITGLVSTSRAMRSTWARAASAERPLGERKREVLALAHCGYIRKSDLAQGVVDGLALRIQDRCLQRDIDMRLHYP
jgi:hypothetical protein